MARDRVLVWGMSNNRAGTETVINSYVQHMPNIAFDFLCYEKPINYSYLFKSPYKNRYFVIPIKIQHPLVYTQKLRKFMNEHGNEYHTLWFNINDVSNIDLLVYAKRYGIQRRIAHMHSSKLPDLFVTKFFSKLNWNKCMKLATERWACSKSAGDFLYHELPYSVLPNMIDVRARNFDEKKRLHIRAKWGLMDSWIIGTVGRLAEEKNHEFLIHLMPKLLDINPSVKLLIVGEGSLEEELTRLARDLGVENQVILVGSQSDIQGFLSAFDVFAFPSLYEGLGISFLEAQFNGLPCVVSEGIPEEAIISSNVNMVNLDNPSKWVNALLQAERGDAGDFLIENRASLYDLRNVDEITAKMF